MTNPTNTAASNLVPWSDVRVWGTTGQGLLRGEERIAALREFRDTGGCAAWLADPEDFDGDDAETFQKGLVEAGPNREDIDWEGFPSAWDYEGYWNAVIGTLTPAAAVREFALEGATRADLDEWLGAAESEAWHAGALGAAFHTRALDALEKAAALYVIWGVGQCDLVGDTDVDLQPYTPWAGRDLVGEEWVASYCGDPGDLDREAAVTGYRQLAEHEIREWRGR